MTTCPSLPVPEETAQALARLAVACFLSDVGLEAWCKLPSAARRSFAQAHGIALDVLPRVNQVIARYVVDDTELQTVHRNAVLAALFDADKPLALSTSQAAP